MYAGSGRVAMPGSGMRVLFRTSPTRTSGMHTSGDEGDGIPTSIDTKS